MFGVLALALLAAAAYWPLLPGHFVMDDRRLVETDNPLVNGTADPLGIWFRADFPLATLAFWLQWLAWGPHPLGYHVINIALHVISAGLAWLVLSRLKVPGAWVAAALFVVHPVCAATVGRIAELKNTLSLPFFLLSWWFFLRYEDDARARWLAGALAAFVLALLAKTSAVMLPVVFLLCAWWQRRRLSREDWIRATPFFIIALGFGAMSVWFQKYQALAGKTLAPETFGERCAIAGRVFWFYLGKAVWPANLNLVYPPWKLDASSPMAYAPVLWLVVAAAICWRFRRTWGRHALFGIGCFAATLFPALGFFDAQFQTHWQVSDHLQYLPLLAPLAMGAAMLAILPWAALTRGAAAGAVLCLTLLGHERARVYSSEETLFRDSLEKNPAAWGVHNDLGVLLAARGADKEAAIHFNAALDVAPDYADAHVNAGKLLRKQGRVEEARRHFEAALKTQYTHPEARRALAEIAAQRGDFTTALRHYRIATMDRPDAGTRREYAQLLFQMGDFPEAVRQLRLALKSEPHSVEALNNLAWALATAPDVKVRNGAEAVRYAREAATLPTPKDMCVDGTLAAAYAEAGDFTNAIATAERAVAAETAAGQTRFAAVNQQLLTLYRAGRAFHMPPPAKQDSFSVDGN